MGVLVKLNASPRNSTVSLSRGLKLLNSETSTLCALEARTAVSVLPRLPNVYGAAALKAAVLNHLFTVCALPRLTAWPFRSGRCSPPKQKHVLVDSLQLYSGSPTAIV